MLFLTDYVLTGESKQCHLSCQMQKVTGSATRLDELLHERYAALGKNVSAHERAVNERRLEGLCFDVRKQAF